MSRFHPLSRQFRVVWFAAIACGLLALPSFSHSQQTGKEQQIKELEKQLADLQKKLADLKGDPAESKGPRPITIADVDSWGGVRGTSLSPDGVWFSHNVGPANGNQETIIRQIKGDKEYRYPSAKGAGGGAMTYSPDSKWIVFSGKKTALLNLANGKKTEFDNVRKVVFNGEAMTHVAVHKTLPPAAPAAAPPAAGKGEKQAPAPAPVTSSGSDLLIHELATGKELTLGNVADFFFDKKGQLLVMTLDTRDQASNGVQLYKLSTGALTTLDSGKASYLGMSWNEKNDSLIMLKGVEDKAYESKLFSILTISNVSGSSGGEKVVYDPHADSTFPKEMAISSNRAPTWTEDHSAFVFNIHPLKKKDDKAAANVETEKKDVQPPVKGDKGKKGGGKKGVGAPPAAAGGDKADLVIWHWLDERIQSQQQVQAAQDKNVSYLCVYRPAEKKFIRLADDKLRQVTIGPKDRYAVGSDGKPYQLMSTLDGKKYADVYFTDMRNGTRQKALTKNRWYNGVSADGTHMFYYDDGHFFTYEMSNGKSHKITGETPTTFINDEDDHNVLKPPTRSLGWTKDGAYVLLSDNWDIWKVPVHGGAGVNLTVNGKKDAIRYRNRVSLNPEEKGIDLNAPQYFTMVGEWTKKSGIGRVDPGKPGVTQLLWDDADFGGIQRSKHGDTVIYTRETNNDYPDYYATDLTFKNSKKLTNGLPKLNEFAWSSGAKLINYTSAKGDKLQGALFLPANYEKGKSYPTIVYIYEKLTQNLHKFQGPAVNGFNKALYTSNGYAVLMPDITYKVNDPGYSAVWCVLPALEAAIATGVVDKDRVGLHGHSWGGYQTAFLVTQTNAFKAAVAGAPLTNMVSMYSSIYWNTGTSNNAIFESSQGRFSGPYWENMEAYIRNSPVHHAKNVNTPLIILHNDKDGAVDFNQGIEYYNTLRRLQKPVVMLQYKGENHGVAKPANRKDYTIRMREFFDHHLMGKPAPAWLTEGVPHLQIDAHIAERAKDQGGGK